MIPVRIQPFWMFGMPVRRLATEVPPEPQWAVKLATSRPSASSERPTASAQATAAWISALAISDGCFWSSLRWERSRRNPWGATKGTEETEGMSQGSVPYSREPHRSDSTDPTDSSDGTLQ